MASAVETPARPVETTGTGAINPRRQALKIPFVVLLGLVLLGAAPLLYWHIAGLLQRPHYQFLVFLPVGIWMLRGASEEQQSRRPLGWLRTTFTVFGLTASLLALGFASLVWSPWIAAVAVSLATFALGWWYFGRENLARWLPIWVLCNLMIPPPFGLDDDLIVGLRGVTTRMTSSVLDQIGILHLNYANVIELPLKPLFIADACSGIHSLFVLLAAALFLGLFLKRSPLHIVLLLISTFGIVLFENIARLVVVAVGLEWRMDLSEGPDHFVLGTLLFVLSLVLVLTTDQLLMFLLPQDPLRPIRWMVAKLGFTGSAGSREASHAQTDGPNSAEMPPRGSKLIAGLVCLFPLAGILQLTQIPPQLPDLSAILGQDIELPEFGRDALPEELAGFQLDGYKTVKRVPGDPFGQASQQWSYRRGNTTAMISLDYPYDGVHDSSVCYTQTGWTLRDESVIQVQPGESDSATEVGRARMHRQLEGDALLLFSMADLHGNQAALIKKLARGNGTERAAERFAAFSQTVEQQAADQAGIRPPCVQFQLLGRSYSGLEEGVESDLIALFLASREILYEKCLASAQTN